MTKKDHLDIINPVLSSENQSNRQKLKVALVGNPNVGKSLFFNSISGFYVDVSNYPGTTVSISKAEWKNYIIFDTPGIYGVSSFNEEEKTALEIILNADIVINIVNSVHLERDLFLTLQLIEMGKKVSVFLNFYDEVEQRNIKIDDKKLSELLGVKVYKSSAISKKGFDKFEEAINEAREGRSFEEVEKLINDINLNFATKAEKILYLEGDNYILNKYNLESSSQSLLQTRERLYFNRRNLVNEIVSIVESENTLSGQFFNKLGRFTLNPITGIPFLVVILFLAYLFIGDIVSQRIVNFTENEIGKKFFEKNLKIFVGKFFPVTIEAYKLNENEEITENKTFEFKETISANPALYKEFKDYIENNDAELEFHFENKIAALLFGEFGAISMTITYLIFLLLPLIISFNIFMSILEDSGYLPRLAAMLDRSFNKIGLNGKAIIPIMLGFGCVTMANITTKILGSEREKKISTALLQFLIPCSAQLSVIAVMSTRYGIKTLLIYIVVMILTAVIIAYATKKLIRGDISPLLLDLPAMRFPSLSNIAKKTYYKTLGFLKEAFAWFFIGAFIIGILQISGGLKFWIETLTPITQLWLKLPPEAASIFIMGMIRRDFGAAGLFNLDLTYQQAAISLIAITLFVPCIASFMVMIKERGLSFGLTIWITAWIISLMVAGISAQIFISS